MHWKGETSMKSKRTKKRTRKWYNHNYYGATSFSAFSGQIEPGTVASVLDHDLIVGSSHQISIENLPYVCSTPLRVTRS